MKIEIEKSFLVDVLAELEQAHIDLKASAAILAKIRALLDAAEEVLRGK